MRINILPNVKRLAINYGDKSISWGYSVWATLYQSTTDEIFGPTNEYLETLPKETLDALWVEYERADHLLNSVGESETLKIELIKVVNNISKLFDFDKVMGWANAGHLFPDPTVPVTNNTRNDDAMTLLRDEAFELSVFCILVKLITPIWGTYVDIVKEDVGNLHKERIAARIFLGSDFTKMRPYKRFERYIEALATSRGKNAATALMHGMAAADLDKYLMGLTLIRRFTVIRLRTTRDGNIIAFIYNFLADKIAQLANSNYRDKFARVGDGDVEGDSYADQYRIPQDVSDEIPITTECYMVDIERLGRDLDFSPETIGNAVKIAKALEANPRFIISDFHVPFSALTLRNKIFPETLYHIERPERIRAIALTAAKAIAMGLDDIYKLMTAVRKPADINTMDMSVQNGRTLRRLPPEIDQQLAACYEHLRPAQISQKTNPGREIIDLTLKEITSSEWLGLEEIENIRSSIALFIIKRDTKC